ncbi:glutamate 5-kinase [Parasphingopyxis lamellibrachiae]|uniref:Glutamate 5-kinase n=1 Tax=Parasphingopyxis lamellibrachiae TaxID=680125 RepID=A0A3D9FEX5_9SPHN|nr:glutamate 5-kinase [Parasphingopyxis lamellibrachiae]RED16370.1 glutamate 5-kinase [Parasphingopyxis lamellibrachiae]
MSADIFDPDNCSCLVIKIGSALLVGEDGAVRREWLAGLADDIADRHARGQKIIVVSSGSVALGSHILELDKAESRGLEDAQAAAAVGQISLSQAWAELLGARDMMAALILVTLGDLEDRRRYLNASATLDRLLSLGAIPVVNENDSVATEAIRFGDNDRLAARVGQAGSAKGVILLSDVAGLYNANPDKDAGAQMIPEISDIDDDIMAMADRGSGSGMGSGGMVSKLEAAKIATSAGIPLAIVSGKRSNPLGSYAKDNVGTIFKAQPPASARKAWLAGRLTSQGQIVIDLGAVEALRGGGSLLSAGAVAISGMFERGDVVDIADKHGKVIARGLAEYDSVSTARIVGKKSVELEEILGYAPRSAIVHRDHMVLF